MQTAELVLFVESRPFEPFRIFIADGRQMDVKSPETAFAGNHGMTIWVLHMGGELEVVDGELITSLKTLGKVDPREFMGSSNQPVPA